jgi:hypothetical protein
VNDTGPLEGAVDHFSSMFLMQNTNICVTIETYLHRLYHRVNIYEHVLFLCPLYRDRYPYAKNVNIFKCNKIIFVLEDKLLF